MLEFLTHNQCSGSMAATCRHSFRRQSMAENHPPRRETKNILVGFSPFPADPLEIRNFNPGLELNPVSRL